MKWLLAATFVVLSSPSFAQQPTYGEQSPGTSEFVDKAANTDMFEIEAGQLAQQKSKDAQVDAYASMVIQDHQKSTSELKSKVQTVPSIQVPTSLDAAHQQKIDKLKSASGAAFLQEFKNQQVQGHQEAIQLFEAYGKNGGSAQLKEWATTMVPKLQEHLQRAQQLPTSEEAPTTGSR